MMTSSTPDGDALPAAPFATTDTTQINMDSPIPTDAVSWADYSLEQIDAGWQQAINEGPTMIGQQVAYALAYSKQYAYDAPIDTHTHHDDFMGGTDAMGLLALVSLSENLSEKQRQRLYDEVTTLTDPALKARGLLALSHHLPLTQRRSALHNAYQLTMTVKSPALRGQLLQHLLPPLRSYLDAAMPSGLPAEALKIANGIGNTEARLRSLTALVPSLPATTRISVLLTVLDAIAAMSQSDAQAGALIALTPHLMDEVHQRALAVAAQIENPAPRARTLTMLAQHLPPQWQPQLQNAALNAIESIANEMTRAQSVASFAPYLEAMDPDDEAFPVLLERALTIAMNMNRREARARALVGLQARLPRELQGEALAAVNFIEDEQTRAKLLAELATSLPQDIAIGALVVAHNLQAPDARFQVLRALGRRLDGGAAERTWLDALAVAVALPRQLERVLALIEIAPSLPDELRERTLINALNTARSISRERARVRAISTLAPLIGKYDQLLADALADAHMINNAMEKASALIALVPYLPSGKATNNTVNEIMLNLRDITVEYRRARALNNLAPHLHGNGLIEGINIAQRIIDPYDRATSLLTLAPQIAEDETRAEILSQALAAAREVTDDYDRTTALVTLWSLTNGAQRKEIAHDTLKSIRSIADEYDRASGLSLFAPLLAEEEAHITLPADAEVLRQALVAAAQLDNSSMRATVLKKLQYYWVDSLPAAVGYALWCEVLGLLSRRTVPHLLSDLGALIHVIHKLGGQKAFHQTVKAISTARTWDNT